MAIHPAPRLEAARASSTAAGPPPFPGLARAAPSGSVPAASRGLAPAASRALALTASLGLALLAGCGGRPSVPDPDRVLEEMDRAAARVQWPGFEAGRIPLAIHDGKDTYLFRHPAPPPEFRPLRGRADPWVHEGRHPAAVENTTAELGGFRTAVAVVDPERPPSTERLAALLLHEAFHVFQEERHPDWSPNEAHLFTYPMEQAELLWRRRLETTALRRALQPPDSAREVCWSRSTLRIRAERFRRLPGEAVAYERGAELWEGLARYVEARGEGRRDPPRLPADGFAPDAVRQRAYEVGHALAHLLDSLDPEWKRKLEAGEESSLDGLLERALARLPGPTCRLPPDEYRRASTVARRDLAELREARARARREFAGAPGWRVTVTAPEGRPLLPGKFDPLNVVILGGGEVLHTRMLTLAGSEGEVEVLGRQALTQAAGAHPLLQGVRRVEVAGLPGEPAVELLGDTLRLVGEGFRAELRGARLERTDPHWRVELGGG